VIESGLDLPDANTIIVTNPESFGLAGLYQLRGRVGRSPKLAHAYFLYPPNIRSGPTIKHVLKVHH
jgi:transcription-repair coupling factor (superfamily II helicase)